MLQAVIAGLGLRYYGAFRGRRAIRMGNWRLHWIPSRRKQNDFASCLTEVLSFLEARNLDADGTHVIGFNDDRDTRAKLFACVSECVRLVWSTKEHAESFGNASFDQELERILGLEFLWRENIRPDDIKSPLMLPDACFSAAAGLETMWRRASRAHSADEILQTGTLIDNFRETYHKDYEDRSGKRIPAYISASHLAFKFPKTADYHGVADDWRHRRKYTREIPRGFHYDVCHKRDQAFRLRVSGREYVVKKYINIDPYGSLRGGE